MDEKAMLNILKDVARKYQPQILKHAKVAIKDIYPSFLPLFDKIFERFYSETDDGGRWYDPYHVAYSTLFAARLVKVGEAPLLIPTMALHDIGYHSPLVDKENWSSPNARIIHMQEGAAMAAEILMNSGKFYPSDVGNIIGMIASHDNGYLGISTANKNRLAVRDADRIWVMHPLSFWKDWLSKKSKGEKISPQELLYSRASSFYQTDEEALFPLFPLLRKSPDKEDSSQSPPTTGLAKAWRDKQFYALGHITVRIGVDNLTEFRDALECHIENYEIY
jgi:hypothetical protein